MAIYLPICVNWSEQRRQPVGSDLTVRIEKDDDVSTCGYGTVVPAPNETFSLGVSDQSDPVLVVRLLELTFKGRVQVLQLGLVVHEQDLFQHVRRRPVKRRKGNTDILI